MTGFNDVSMTGATKPSFKPSSSLNSDRTAYVPMAALVRVKEGSSVCMDEDRRDTSLYAIVLVKVNISTVSHAIVFKASEYGFTAN